MSKLIKTVFAGTAAVMIAAVVLAQAPATDTAAAQPQAAQAQKSVLQKMDRDGDGKVTRDEHKARLSEWLKELDKNNDGKLSPDEFEGARFVETDLNKDGTITVEEYLVFFVGKDVLAKAEGTPAADKLYSKEGGEITGVEVIAYRKSVFKAADANADGKLTADELKASNSKEFGFLDKDTDGFITVDEITAVAVMPVFVPKAEETKAAAPVEK